MGFFQDLCLFVDDTLVLYSLSLHHRKPEYPGNFDLPHCPPPHYYYTYPLGFAPSFHRDRYDYSRWFVYVPLRFSA